MASIHGQIPKVRFIYSGIYDWTWKTWADFWVKHHKPSNEFERKRIEKYRNYPTKRIVKNYMAKIESMWRKKEKKVFKELAKITGLKWKSETIDCYVVGRTNPLNISHPLTIQVYEKNPEIFMDILVHELIHQLFVQNSGTKQAKKTWNHFHRKYKKYSWRTRIHIPLHAIHSHIYLKLFDESRLQENILRNRRWQDYRDAWDVVQKEGHENIIKEYTKAR